VNVLRTPDDRFHDLPDFDYEPRYAEIADGEGGLLRMAYVQAGPSDGPVVLLLHGEPTWSFLYRHVMRDLAGAGIRSVAFDLVGFGRSDKPESTADHSYARHVEWVRALAFDVLDLRDVTLVGQDWGGLIGLRLVAEHPERFASVVAANTGLPTGDHDMPEVWWQFRHAVEKAEDLDIGRLVRAGCVRPMSAEVRAAYDAPFPSEEYKAGPRVMPTLVPTAPEDPATEANRSWSRSATPTRSPGAWRRSSGAASPVPPGSTTRSSRTPATSCRRTQARGSVRWSRSSSEPAADVERWSWWCAPRVSPHASASFTVAGAGSAAQQAGSPRETAHDAREELDIGRPACRDAEGEPAADVEPADSYDALHPEYAADRSSWVGAATPASVVRRCSAAEDRSTTRPAADSAAPTQLGAV
jgi:haloalkane dehalogenase